MVVGAVYILEDTKGLNYYTDMLCRWFYQNRYKAAAFYQSSCFNNILLQDQQRKVIIDFDDSLENIGYEEFKIQTVLSALTYPGAKLFNYQSVDEKCLMLGISDGTEENTAVYVIDPDGEYREAVQYPDSALIFHDAFTYLAREDERDRLRSVLTQPYDNEKKRIYDIEACLNLKHGILSVGYDRYLYDNGYCEAFCEEFKKSVLRFRPSARRNTEERIAFEGKPCFDLCANITKTFKKGERISFDVINRGRPSRGMVVAISNALISEEENRPEGISVENLVVTSCLSENLEYDVSKPSSYAVDLNYDFFFGSRSFCGENGRIPIFAGIIPQKFEKLKYFFKKRLPEMEEETKLNVSFDVTGDVGNELLVYVAPSANTVNGRCIAHFRLK